MRVQDARFQQAALNYQQTVLSASAEAENAINTFLKAQEALVETQAAAEAAEQSVHLAIYDIHGRQLAVLVDRKMSAGTHHVGWDGRDSRGRQVASGVYFCRLKTADAAFARKMVKLN